MLNVQAYRTPWADSPDGYGRDRTEPLVFQLLAPVRAR